MDEQHAIIIADRDGVIWVWNEGAERMLGHRAEEAVGQKVDLIIPQRYRSAHWAGFGAAVERGATKSDELKGNLPLLRADGTEQHYAGKLIFLRDALGASVGAMGVFAPGEVSGNGLMTLP